MTNSNEFQFFWSRGPLDWTSWMSLKSFTRYSGSRVDLYSYDPDLSPGISNCRCLDANEILPREIHERVRRRFEDAYGSGCGYREAADIFRYKLLYEKGGWYFDTDCLLIRPLTPLFNLDYVFAWELPTSVNNAVLKFPRGDPLLDQLYQECLVRSPLTCLPGTVALFNKYLKKFNLIDRVLPRNYFYPISPGMRETTTNPAEGESYVMHLYTSIMTSKFHKSRGIELLEREIQILNNSLGLRIARKIPFGKQIREILADGRLDCSCDGNSKPEVNLQLSSPDSASELLTGLHEFTAQWERYIEQDERDPTSPFIIELKEEAKVLSRYLLSNIGRRGPLDSVKGADFELLAKHLQAFGNWKTLSAGDIGFENMEKIGMVAYDIANGVLDSKEIFPVRQ